MGQNGQNRVGMLSKLSIRVNNFGGLWALEVVPSCLMSSPKVS